MSSSLRALARSYPSNHHTGHAHFWERASAHGISRGQFIKTASGATAAALSSGLWLPGLAHADSGTAAPRPIPGTVAPGAPFHIVLPGPVDQGHEPSLITDFNGFIGLANVDGTGTGTNASGASTSLVFDVDVRFMDGVYIGVDGKTHAGTFGFVWLDLYKGQVGPSNQVHDFNPGIFPFPSGLFWTTRIPQDSVQINPGAGRASMRVANLALGDYTNLANALSNGASVAAMVSFDIQWSGVTRRVRVRDTVNGFAGDYVENRATIAWSATEAGFSFTSDDASTSKSIFAVIGHEHNGVFFP